MLPVVELRGAMPLGMSSALWGNFALDLGSSVTASIIGGILACFVVVTIFIPLKKLLQKIKLCRKFFDHFEVSANHYLTKFNSKNSQKTHKICKKHAKNTNFDSTMQRIVPRSSPIPQDITSHPERQKATQQITFQNKTEQSSQHPPRTKNNGKNTFSKCLFVFLFCAAPLPFTGVWSAGALCSLLNIGYFYSVTTLIFANLFGTGIMTLFCWLFQNYIDLVLTIVAIIMMFVAIYYFTKFVVLRSSKKDNSTFLD